MKPVIELEKLTKDYGEGRGIFDIDLNIAEGEMLGFAGTNGSGKTTTIRNIMGFLKPTSGAAYVNGLEAWSHSSEIVKNIGYVPGEIAFPDLPTGTEFLRSQAEFLGVKDLSKAEHLIEKLQLDPRAPLKRMSKGMKQKTAIVAALMADPKIIILDEPTTGLDPLMRDSFLEIIRAEHAAGKTILMSSHMFGELETTCDRVALIQNGHIVDIAVISDIKNRREREYKIEFKTNQDMRKFGAAGFNVVREQPQYNQLTISIDRDEINQMFKELKGLNVRFIAEVSFDLERYFKTVLRSEKERKNYVQ